MGDKWKVMQHADGNWYLWRNGRRISSLACDEATARYILERLEQQEHDERARRLLSQVEIDLNF